MSKECIIDNEMGSFSEDTKANLERNLSILNQFMLAGNNPERSWEKIINIIKH